ncbi:hypothetical protein AVEN_269528-1 [Araneus ventricosus]|uniref:Uncharacterized protein n=1 Tax=Araneus ventricosus TaxID=182803 RepID=A0A4Y2U897_ARAVE|nr:hypothetical protein AVEN_269528-1 [Araneus ventricosus]
MNDLFSATVLQKFRTSGIEKSIISHPGFIKFVQRFEETGRSIQHPRSSDLAEARFTAKRLAMEDGIRVIYRELFDYLRRFEPVRKNDGTLSFQAAADVKDMDLIYSDSLFVSQASRLLFLLRYSLFLEVTLHISCSRSYSQILFCFSESMYGRIDGNALGNDSRQAKVLLSHSLINAGSSFPSSNIFHVGETWNELLIPSTILMPVFS